MPIKTPTQLRQLFCYCCNTSPIVKHSQVNQSFLIKSLNWVSITYRVKIQLRRGTLAGQVQMMVHKTTTAINISKPALPTLPVNCMMPNDCTTTGFTLLALTWKSMAIIPIDTSNPQCIQSTISLLY
jgi:hypothetical protein